MVGDFVFGGVPISENCPETCGECADGNTCEDESACNFGDEDDCIYPEENYDCDGNCVVVEDCLGVCGGDAVVDEW